MSVFECFWDMGQWFESGCDQPMMTMMQVSQKVSGSKGQTMSFNTRVIQEAVRGNGSTREPHLGMGV